jgi:hypothetical protein
MVGDVFIADDHMPSKLPENEVDLLSGYRKIIHDFFNALRVSLAVIEEEDKRYGGEKLGRREGTHMAILAW